MRILYLDIDTLRPDHLGCYGYPRPTSPRIDALAAEGIRFDQLYASDSPCLPSRTALTMGRFGTATGVVNHGGRRAELYPPGRDRGRQRGLSTWPELMRRAGLHTVTISTFAERHSAYHWYAGYNEAINLGSDGREIAGDVAAAAESWLRRRGQEDHWFLHVHFWDPHTPYRTPVGYGDPFSDTPAPIWIDPDVLAAHRGATGPHCARDLSGWGDPPASWRALPRQPLEADGIHDVARIFDGYDTAIRYADEHIGRLLDLLAELGVAEETAVLVSSDHGENLGELGIYCDHQTADLATHRLPGILRWPGLGPGVDQGLRYQFDLAATMAELTGAEVPRSWDGCSFAPALASRSADAGGEGRVFLVLSCGAWTVQRSVRFDDWLCIWTFHDGWHGFPEVMLFDVVTDPYEQHDLAPERPDLVARATVNLSDWMEGVMRAAGTGVDPLWTVVSEGGGYYVRDRLPAYLDRLRSTGRHQQAERLAHRPRPVGPT